MFKMYEEDMNNYIGVKNQVLNVDDKEHMQLLLQIVSNRAISIESDGCSSICNSDKTDMITYNAEKKDLVIYEQIEEGLFKPVARFGLEDNAECDDFEYIFIEEKALVQGVYMDEEGNPTGDADLIGISLIALSGPYEEGFEYSYEEWIDEDEECIKANFEPSHFFVSKEVESLGYLSL